MLGQTFMRFSKLMRPVLNRSKDCRILWKKQCTLYRTEYFSSESKLTLNIDKTAVHRLKSIIENKEFLRVFVEGGGCSGFQYKFEIDTEIDEDCDMIFEKDGVKVVADEESVKILNGSTVEYHADLIRAGFRVIDIPQAEKGCSCGVSFSVKL